MRVEDELKIAQSNIYQNHQITAEQIKEMKAQMQADARQAEIDRLELQLKDCH